MARKGIRRAHTGCITCKIRRIKCDETQPHCLRCISTGRKCDGYKSWVSKALHRIRPSIIPEVGSTEMRSLDFYRQAVAPNFTGPLPRSFWTFDVTRVMHQDLAVRHAIVALSTLYEQFDKDSQQKTPESDFAIHHYNIAIQLVINFREHNGHLDAVLVACIVFMGIERFNHNPKGALVHYEHGMGILRSYQPYLPLVSHFEEIRCRLKNCNVRIGPVRP